MFFKRVFDLLFSIVMIIVLFPVLLVLSILIVLIMGYPIFYKQARVGKNHCEFSILKFRTMLPKSDALNTDGQRVTRFGVFLRKYSLDEFPQIVNILKGDMSFIGPRPLLPKYIQHFNQREIKRHQVRPGMSGLAQVNGRSFLSWEEQFEIDVDYVERISFFMDVSIFFKTLPKVLGSKDMMITGRIDALPFDEFSKQRTHGENE